jgi:hypothetical protein
LDRRGSLFASKRAAEAFDLLTEANVEDFVALLRECHDLVMDGKESNALISPGFFERVSGEATLRGKINLTHVNGVWLDNDGGGITHEEFAKLLPRLRLVIYNSYSSTTALPRWRAFIPTNMLMPVEVHQRIVADIMAVLRHNGWRSAKEMRKNPRIKARDHGFDMGKVGGTSMFYLPCQAGAGAGHSFFQDYADAGRATLNVLNVISSPVVPYELPVEPGADAEAVKAASRVPPSTSAESLRPGQHALERLRAALVEEAAQQGAGCQQQRVNDAVTEWRATPKSAGHDAFFDLARQLHNAGLGGVDLQRVLFAEAGYARIPAERRAEVRDLVRKFSGQRRWHKRAT